MLTKQQRDLLTHMRDSGEELVFEDSGEWAYVGNRRVPEQMVMDLNRLYALRNVGDQPGDGLERYQINETGLKLLCA